MEGFVSYLLKSAVWLSGFALVYMFFLRNERFFILKRMYLIAGIIISFLFPVVTIQYSLEIPSPPPVPDLFAETSPGQLPLVSVAATDRNHAEQKRFNYMYLLAAVYLAGAIFLFIKNIWHFTRLFTAMRKSRIDSVGSAKLVRTSEYASSFSFFNYVFVNPSISDNEVQEIMNHELVHVDQKHWFDLLLGEFLRMLQWANPFAWIYTGFIRLNHEYLADEVALQRSSDPALYKAALLNQVFRAPVISLSNSFNYSITKTRFDMMKKIVTSPYRKLKVLFILPVFAIILFAFSTPVYRYTPGGENPSGPLAIYEATPVKAVVNTQIDVQQGIKGTVKDAEGKPVSGAVLVASGTMSNPPVTTDKDGNFTLPNVPKEVNVLVSAPGFKGISVKPDFVKPMDIRLEKDPEFKFQPQVTRAEPLVIIDGEISDIKFSELRKELGHNLGTTSMIQGKLATDKYGEKAANGVVEVLTRKKALEMGLNPPYPRIDPEDFPTFQGNSYNTFTGWVSDRVTYPEEARSKGIEGWVSVNYTVQKDGSITIGPVGNESLQILSNEIIKVINSAPKFEPPKNPEANEPFSSSITLGFRLPDQIVRDPPFVVVESMPAFPGGDAALLQYIKDNIKYPEELKKDTIEGRVILRFVVTSEGKTEGISVLKSVHPVMDAEAIRVVQSLKGWHPGMQGGKAVNVWYMVPVTFTPPAE